MNEDSLEQCAATQNRDCQPELMGMPKRVAVLIPQAPQLDFIQILRHLRRKWIATYLGPFA